MQNANAPILPSGDTLSGGSFLQEPVLAIAGYKPMFAAYPLVYERDKSSSAVSFTIHAAMIALILALAMKARMNVMATPAETVTPIDFEISVPPIRLPVAIAMGGGGGGGAHEIVEAIKGHPPAMATIPILAPPVLRLDHPSLAVEPTESVKMQDSSPLTNLGMADSPQITQASQGRGSGSGFGQGQGGGIGSGRGLGAGPGSGGGYGGGVMSVGGGVAAPLVIHSVQPEFTDDARRANYQGSVSIKLIVDSQGNPQDVRLASHLGMGLEAKAIEAVRQYRFRPAMYQGHAVAVQIVIDVDFHLH
jgi:TonB family protein